MYITLHLSDGRKITKDESKLLWFSSRQKANRGDVNQPEISDDCITVNIDHVIDVRQSTREEIDHAINHGW